MDWNIEEALSYYKKMGAPEDQHMLIELLKEIQDNNNNFLSLSDIKTIAVSYNIKENFLLAIIKRIPRLHLNNKHILEICQGANCRKTEDFSSFIEKTYGRENDLFEIKYINCMRMCGKGPNIKWDGTLYNNVTKNFIYDLIEKNK